MPTDKERSIDDVLASAQQLLSFARQGAADYDEGSERMASGLHNAVSCGRSVTFTLQNLKHKVDGWDEWYAPIQARLRDDPVATWFKDLRNLMEKQGTMGATRFQSSININTDVLYAALPEGATNMSIDAMGRMSYAVRLPDGSRQKFYTQLPPEMARVELQIASAPGTGTTAELLRQHLDHLQTIIDEAVAKWGTQA